MIKSIGRSFVFSVILQVLAFSSALADETITFDNPETLLSGKLLGNYVMLGTGEMLKGFILYLDEPISINGNKNSQNRANRGTVRNVQHILVEFEIEEPPADSLGDVVQLKGRLLNEPSGPHHTKVLMKATLLTVIEEATDGEPVATFKTHLE